MILPKIYHAPPPKQPLRWWFLKPWHWLADRLIRRWLSYIVYPAQYIFNRVDFSDITSEINHHPAIKRHVIVTHDKARLDTIEIEGGLSNKYIIAFGGNGTCYETLYDELLADATQFRCHVIGFNHRNVNKSKGMIYSQNDLLVDAIAEVQRLLDNGVVAENIVLKGHSLGAAIASMTTKYFHEQGHKVRIFNDRSFSSLTQWVVSRLVNTDKPNSFQSAIAAILRPLISGILKLLDWEMEAASPFLAIPKQYREHIVVRSSRQERAKQGASCDHVILHGASMHMALKPERRRLKAKVSQAERNRFKINKFTSNSQYAHSTDLNYLHDRLSGKSAQHFFSAFFYRPVSCPAVNFVKANSPRRP